MSRHCAIRSPLTSDHRYISWLDPEYNTLKMMMALNSFGPRFDPQSILSYNDWVANNTFDPFGPEPFLPISHSNPGISLHFQTGSELSIGKGADVDNRVDRGHGSSEDMTRNFPKEVSSDPPLGDCELETNGIFQRSRFAFAQKPIERTTDMSVSQIPVAHVHQSPAGRSQVPIPIKATPAAVLWVVGLRPFQRASHTRREPTLAVPKAVHPLPTWLTHFEDYEELLTKFCPSEASSPSTSTFPVMAGVECYPNQCPPLNATPLLGFEDSDSDSDSHRHGHAHDLEASLPLHGACERSSSSGPCKHAPLVAPRLAGGRWPRALQIFDGHHHFKSRSSPDSFYPSPSSVGSR